MELIALDYKFWEESDKYLTEKKFFEEKCLSIVAIFAGSPADGPLNWFCVEQRKWRISEMGIMKGQET